MKKVAKDLQNTRKKTGKSCAKKAPISGLKGEDSKRKSDRKAKK